MNTKSPSLETLQDYRRLIDSIDEQLTALLAQRLELAEKVGKLKSRMNLGVEDKTREQAIIDRIADYTSNPRFIEHIRDVFRGIFTAAKQVQ